MALIVPARGCDRALRLHIYRMQKSGVSSSLETWHRGEAALKAGRLDEAREAYSELLMDRAWLLPARLRLSVVASTQGRVREAAAQALAGFESRDGADAVLLEALCRRLVEVGELEAAVTCAAEPVVRDATDPALLAGVGGLLGDQSLPALALPMLQRAREMGGPNPWLAGRIGRALAYVGDADDAELALESCLAAGGTVAAMAWRDLARLRRWTPERNHVERLRRALVELGEGHRDAPLLQYALFKELDDLGRTDEAWSALEAGMQARRAQVGFDPAAEADLFEALSVIPATPTVIPAKAGIQSPSQAWIPASAGMTNDRAGMTNDRVGMTDVRARITGGPQPIFIVGLPRSGTTLLERILGGHPQVADAGELRDFTAQLRWMTELPGTNHPDAELVRAAAGIDFAQLGQRYLSHTRWHARGKPFYTDKLPANFLNVGFIAQALPDAKILHMARGPMDACFSNLKELFGAAYPHSYDQGEMAEHYIRYRKLMAHWHAAFPGRILDVSYEALAAEPERVAREVLAFCGLPWDDAVLSHERRGGAVATASTAQVREPIHARFVGQWRRYEAQLRPLRERLEAGGFEG